MMLAELESLETRNRQAARDQFIVAVWDDRRAEELLPLARAAGMSGQEADKVIERIAQARKHVAHTEQLGRLRKDASAAAGRLAKMRAHADAEIDKLEKQVLGVAYESRDAAAAVAEAEKSSRLVLEIHGEGLVPPSRLPSEASRLIERHKAQQVVEEVDAARVAVGREVEHYTFKLARLEKQLHDLPLSITSRQDEAWLKDRIEEAKRQLTDAQARLKKAQAAVDSARKKVP